MLGLHLLKYWVNLIKLQPHVNQIFLGHCDGWGKDSGRESRSPPLARCPCPEWDELSSPETSFRSQSLSGPRTRNTHGINVEIVRAFSFRRQFGAENVCLCYIERELHCQLGVMSKSDKTMSSASLFSFSLENMSTATQETGDKTFKGWARNISTLIQSNVR